MNYSFKTNKTDNSLATNASICDIVRDLFDDLCNIFHFVFKIFHTYRNFCYIADNKYLD